MKRMKFDRAIEKSVIRQLDAIQRKYGVNDTRHAVNKWSHVQADKIRLAKQRRALERELAEVNRKLK